MLAMNQNLVSCLKNTAFNDQGKKIFFIDGVLISGSSDGCQYVKPTQLCNITSQYTAELYVPSSGVLCSLPQLPDKRNSHTMESSGLLCGGLYTKDSCVQWSPANGTWNKLLTMDDERYSHVSWTPSTGNGTYLIGGIYSRTRKTTTLIRPDGTQDPGFPLKYVTE